MKKARIGLALCLTSALGLMAPAATAAPVESVAGAESPKGVQGALKILWEDSLHMAAVVEHEADGFSRQVLHDLSEGKIGMDQLMAKLQYASAVSDHLFKTAQEMVAESAEALSS